jgi:hypothetical protein
MRSTSGRFEGPTVTLDPGGAAVRKPTPCARSGSPKRIGGGVAAGSEEKFCRCLGRIAFVRAARDVDVVRLRPHIHAGSRPERRYDDRIATRRFLTITIVGVVLTPATACGTTARKQAARSRAGQSSGPVEPAAHQDPGKTGTHTAHLKGTVNGTVAFYIFTGSGRRPVPAVVKVFGATGRLVARKDVRSNDPRFRFRLSAGSYDFKLTPRKYWASELCRTEATVAVRANRAAQVKLGTPCAPY